MNKKDTRILFMGTPDIAKTSLEQIIADDYNIVGVFTREDKPVGRSKELVPTPVKKVALEHNIPVYQPKTLKGEMIEVIKDINPDLIVVVAYGRILPKEILDIPALGCINLHVSLLPKYRGAAPIQWSLINGDKETGVTVMMIDEGLDTGDIIDVLPIEIDENENQIGLFTKVAEEGKIFLSKTIQNIIDGNITLTKQDETKATIAPMLTKEMSLFDFDNTALVLHNKIRGLNPWPGTHFEFQDKKIKVLETKVSQMCGKIGEILSVKPLVIACKEQSIEILKTKPEGSKEMSGQDFAMGRRLKIGDIITEL